MSAGHAVAAMVLIGAGGAAVYMASRYRRGTPAVTYVTYETQGGGGGGNNLAWAAPFLDLGIDALFSGNLFGGNRTNETSDTTGGIFSGWGAPRTPEPTQPTRGNTGGGNTGTAGGGGTGPGGVDFGAYEAQYGLPSGYLHRTAQIESSMNPNAKNPRSSAGGLFQFINATARDYGLVDRYDPTQATDAASRLARDNARTLRGVLGREPTGGELYLAHQQGGAGAARLLRDRNARAVDVVGSAAVKLNGGTSSMTAGQFADLWIKKHGGA